MDLLIIADLLAIQGIMILEESDKKLERYIFQVEYGTRDNKMKFCSDDGPLLPTVANYEDTGN